MDEKAAKESFVRDLSGTTFTEVYVIVGISVAWLLVRHVGIVGSSTIQQWHRKSIVFAFLWDFSTVLLPSTLALTVLADYLTYFFIVWLIVLAAFLIPILIPIIKHSSQTRHFLSQFMSQPYSSSLPCIRETRVWTNTFTVIAILAVDFHIFPRRLAKVETYGNGLMDVGIGCFMICHGMVSREARDPRNHTAFPKVTEYLRSVGYTAWKTWPFLLVGVLRLLSVKATDYQEHVTEYGVHWNFFFTIAVVRLLATMLQPPISLLPVLPHGLTAIVTATSYQLLLSTAGLREFIVYGPAGDYSRNGGLLSANREGIVSCLGHLAIFFAGVEIGKQFFYASRNGGKVVDMLKVAAVVAVVCVLLVPVMLWSDGAVENTSRRFANLTYCLWMVSFSSFVLTVNFLIDLSVMLLCSISHTLPPSSLYYTATPTDAESKHRPHFCLISAIDYNQFAFFMLANILTGCVNFTVDTLNTSSAPALSILSLYMITLALVVTLLHRNKIKFI